MAVLPRRARSRCCTRASGARVVLIGGAPLGHRFMVWNFVSSRKERIVQAQDDWEAQRFAKVPGRDRVHSAAAAARLQSLELVASPAPGHADAQRGSMPSRITAFMPKVSAPSRRASAR